MTLDAFTYIIENSKSSDIYKKKKKNISFRKWQPFNMNGCLGSIIHIELMLNKWIGQSVMDTLDTM